MAEQWVKLLAHWKGCEVFQNVGCTGETDIVIIHPTLGAIQVDVKCSAWRPKKGTWEAVSAWSVKRPVYAVCVEPDGDVSNWRVSWRNLRRGCTAKNAPIWDCPPGWEDFWSNDNRFYLTK